MTRVVNLRAETYDVYIGRPSKWGNPYKIGPDGARHEVIAKYRQWLIEAEAGRQLLASIPELRGKVLGCYCKPLPCHGDVLAEIANG